MTAFTAAAFVTLITQFSQRELLVSVKNTVNLKIHLKLSSHSNFMEEYRVLKTNISTLQRTICLRMLSGNINILKET